MSPFPAHVTDFDLATPSDMRGGKPGVMPSIKEVVPHPIPLDYFDPFGAIKKMSPERKEQALYDPSPGLQPLTSPY